MNTGSLLRVGTFLVALCSPFHSMPARAQGFAPPAPDLMGLPALAWLAGCWQGVVNQREFREHWLPLRGGMMVGAGHIVMQDRTQDFQYLKLESRVDGVYYVTLQPDKKEFQFHLTGAATDDKDTIWTFVRTGEDFPQRIIYRRGTEGWLYASAEGKLNGEDRRVIYPMRRVNCETGEFILK